MTEQPRLAEPHVRYLQSLLPALPAYRAENLFPYVELTDAQLTDLATAIDGSAYLESLVAPYTPPEHAVPATNLWYVRGEEFLGWLRIRHALTPALRVLGGHIGYDVAPAARRQGHATRMLALALPVARDLGIDPALLTCYVDNTGSRRVIERNGGVPVDRVDREDGILRFWLPTPAVDSAGNRATLDRTGGGVPCGCPRYEPRTSPPTR